MIYNPYFEQAGIDAVVVPMACRAEHYASFLRAVFTLDNIRGALITMPHKVTTVAPARRGLASGADRRRLQRGPAQRRRPAGRRHVRRRGFRARHAAQGLPRPRARGRWSSAAAASARRSRPRWPAPASRPSACSTPTPDAADALADRLSAALPGTGGAHRLQRPGRLTRVVVNATPLGMNDGDPMPMDVSRIAPEAFVGEVVMKAEMTAFLHAAQARGCRFQVGTDMLFEQIPAYLEFFGLPTTTAENSAHGRAAGRLSGLVTVPCLSDCFSWATLPRSALLLLSQLHPGTGARCSDRPAVPGPACAAPVDRTRARSRRRRSSARS